MVIYKFFVKNKTHIFLHFSFFCVLDQQNSGKYAEFLINNGADFEAKDSLGRTPYDLAVQYGNVLEI